MSDADRVEIEADMVPAPVHAHTSYWWAANCPVCGTRRDAPYSMDAIRDARNCCSVEAEADQ